MESRYSHKAIHRKGFGEKLSSDLLLLLKATGVAITLSLFGGLAVWSPVGAVSGGVAIGALGVAIWLWREKQKYEEMHILFIEFLGILVEIERIERDSGLEAAQFYAQEHLTQLESIRSRAWTIEPNGDLLRIRMTALAERYVENYETHQHSHQMSLFSPFVKASQ